VNILIVVICIVVLVGAGVFLKISSKWPVSNIGGDVRNVCAVCGAKSQYGYSQHAEEEPAKLKPLCRKCLIAQLEKDYSGYLGRAVVVQPASGPPCFVFQPINDWNAAFKRSKIGRDAQSLLVGIEPQCHDCSRKPNYLWVESSGLTGENFSETLDRGISQTLLLKNPKPISLCGKCCVARIGADLEARDIKYLEVCGPKGDTDGFVVPMGY
jgi:hypothetical protein